MAESRIHRNPVQPGEKRRLPAEALDRLKGFDKRVLREVGRIFAILSHVVDDPQNPLAIFGNQTIKSCDITGLDLPDDNKVGIRLLPSLGRGNHRLSACFDRIHEARRKWQSAGRRKRKVHRLEADRASGGIPAPNDPAHGSPTQPHLCLLGLETGDLYLQDLAKT